MSMTMMTMPEDLAASGGKPLREKTWWCRFRTYRQPSMASSFHPKADSYGHSTSEQLDYCLLRCALSRILHPDLRPLDLHLGVISHKPLREIRPRNERPILSRNRNHTLLPSHQHLPQTAETQMEITAAFTVC